MEKARKPVDIRVNDNGVCPHEVLTRAYEFPDMVFLSFEELFPNIEVENITKKLKGIIDNLPHYIAVIDDSKVLPNASCGGVPFKSVEKSNITAIVHNYALLGEACASYSKSIPTFVAYWLQADLWDKDPEYMDYAFTAKYALTTIEMVKNLTNNDKVLVFDGIENGINVSKSLANEILGLVTK